MAEQSTAGAEKVGGIYYDVSLDTAQMVRGQREVDSALRKTSGSMDGFDMKLNRIVAAIKIYATALAIVKSINIAEDMRLLKTRVDIASGSIEKGNDAWSELVKISRTSQTSVEANASTFARLNQSILQLGGTQRDTLQLTDLLAKAIKVSGANAVESKAAMLQFAQALGSGKLAGDELRSLMENAPYLMRKLADGLGVPIGQLKSLGEQGKLTSDVVVNALAKAAASIEKDFGAIPQTFSGAMTALEDAAATAVEKFDAMTGSSAVAAGVIKGLVEVIDLLAKQFEEATTESDKLTRGDRMKVWAERGAQAFSYLADAGDFIVRMFRQAGVAIGGALAAADAALSGNFRGAGVVIAQMKDDIAAIGDAPYAGQKIRQTIETKRIEDRGFTPAQSVSKLKSPANPEEQRKLQARRLAAQAYYEGLIADQKTAVEKINAEEQKALTENSRRMASDVANSEIYAKAKVAITEKYARERALLEEKNLQEVAELRIATTVDEIERVQEIRDEELRRADAQQRLGVLTAEQAERARALALFRAAEGFDEIAERNAQARADAEIAITMSHEREIALTRDEAIRRAEEGYRRGQLTFEEAEAAKVRAARAASDQMRELQRSREDTVIGTLQIRAGMGGVDDQEALIRAQAAAQLAAVEEARQRDLEAAQIYADQKVAIEAAMNQQIADLRAAANIAALSATSDGFGALADVLRKSAGEQSGIYKAMFIAQKAFSIASSLVAINTGIANASSLPFPANIAAMASVAAATASIIAAIQSVNYGGARRYGGPTSAGSLYRVNESGRPEMFTASTGAQYMLPTKDGRVTPAGSGGGMKVVVNNYAGAEVRTSQGSDGSAIVDIERRMVNAVAADTARGGVTARATAGRMGLNTGATLNRRRG